MLTKRSTTNDSQLVPNDRPTDLDLHGFAGALHEPRQLDGLAEDGVVGDLVADDTRRARAGVHANPDLDPVPRLEFHLERHNLEWIGRSLIMENVKIEIGDTLFWRHNLAQVG